MTRLNLLHDTDIRIRKEIQARMKNSPDLVEIKQTVNKVPVFVYGSLKAGFPNHDFFLRDSDYLGKARTLRSNYKMYSACGGYYPVVMEDAAGDHIYGEVYTVTPDQIIDLDRLESNGHMYIRTKHPIKMLDQFVGNHEPKQNPIIHCYTYIGNPSVMAQRIQPDLISKIIDNQPKGFYWEKTMSTY